MTFETYLENAAHIEFEIFKGWEILNPMSKSDERASKFIWKLSIQYFFRIFLQSISSINYKIVNKDVMHVECKFIRM